MIFSKTVETNSVSIRLRKPYTFAEYNKHTIMTDDVFSFVDFYFKTHKKVLKDKNGKEIKQNHHFFWQQANYFYQAAKVLPIEAAPLPMYYCMLNAVKAYLVFSSTDISSTLASLNCHGLKEGHSEDEARMIDLSTILVKRKNSGVFYAFAKKLEPCFEAYWPVNNLKSIKELLFQLPFVHGAYASTYNLPRKREKFIPMISNEAPTFKYGVDKRIYLTAELDRNYFKPNAQVIPEEIKLSIPSDFEINSDNSFEIISKVSYRKKDLKNGSVDSYRRNFSYIAAPKRLWYIKREKIDDELDNICSMILEIAVAHRFSEIVRYKPEQMIFLLNSKENWFIHEFLTLVLNQFMDEIACEITKQEIMPTRVK